MIVFAAKTPVNRDLVTQNDPAIRGSVVGIAVVSNLAPGPLRVALIGVISHDACG
jgi:hypothetical protein